MNRRQFIGVLGAGLVATPALSSAKAPRLPMRALGRTGLKTPLLALGCGSRLLMYQQPEKALEAIEQALALGIRYLDTAHAYGNGKSEEWIGQLMPARRKDVILATKIPGRTADQARREIELSLKRLRTDRLEVLHIHALANDADLAAIEAKGGVLEALYEARDQKVTRAIGITCHAAPLTLKKALERHDFDCVQMALNAGLAFMADTAAGMKATRGGGSSFEAVALPVAQRKKLGVIAMKVFGQEQLLETAPVEKLLAYALSLPVSVASVGMPKLELIRQNVLLAREFRPMLERDRRRLSESIASSTKLALAGFFRDHQDA